MRRVGRPCKQRPMTNPSENLAPEQGNESVNKMKAESHPNSLTLEPKDKLVDRITQLLTTIVQQTCATENTIERALNIGATSFDGSGDPDSAISWLNHLERVFRVMGCPDEQKLACAAFLLTGRADDWWESVQHKNTGVISWDEFKRQFNAYYYPKFYQNLKMNDFFKLVQGPLTVEAYEKKFTELSRAAPFVVENEENKCRKFKEGLRHEIKIYVSSVEHTNYGKLVDAALRVEKTIEDVRKFEQQRQKRSSQGWSIGGSSSKVPKTGVGYSGQASSYRQSYGMSSSQGSIKPPTGRQSTSMSKGKCLQCQRCNRRHDGECYWGTSSCYHCGQVGHIKRNCPELISSGTMK